MMAGADFIKTSTGKSINANLNNSLVMLRMIRDFYNFTGKKLVLSQQEEYLLRNQFRVFNFSC